ncbi:carboxymuconolactone decarboxylase family protein [Agarivorans sp. Alg241-V36]|uniref:carboxymuconolactone decarboxylase family protein n=1 Tax=Agarivorans sp. Alg241-V36 TaxID=2305992 RepID=UPI0013D7EAC8|nr:carboxymuconolactone decarboxylase family protein [Agarivorans sp. Alg241-V36]
MTKINYLAEAPKAMQALIEQEEYLKSQFSQHPSLGIKLLELVKLRVSQINQCAFCIDMHRKGAIKAGDSWQRLNYT